VTALRDRFRAPAVMGIVNVTPDSFSDGGDFLDPDAAVAHALTLAAEGADLLDIGGESTRPGSDPVSADEELRRVIPVIERLSAATDVPISVDTMKAAVAEAAVAAGASFVNDVTALRHDPRMAGVVARSGAALCLMHMLGEPKTMQRDPRYGDVVADVAGFLRERVEHAVACGVDRERISVDPGIGFGKTLEHNLALIRRFDELEVAGCPVLVGVSRKRFLGAITGADEHARGPATLAACLALARRGAWMLRVHEVAPVRQALAVQAAIEAPV
jgi:dihydropteroate synthase